MNSTYILWHPRLRKSEDDNRSEISFNVTRLSSLAAPYGSIGFYRQLLRNVGITAEPVSWRILAYRSRYHGDLTSPSWMERWPVNWRVTLLLEPRLKALPVYRDEYLESYALPEDTLGDGVDYQSRIHCFVISDFRAKQINDEAVVGLQDQIYSRLLQLEGPRPRPVVEIVPLGSKFVQLQIDLGEYQEEFFAEGASSALEVEDQCRNAGGICSFDIRADHWGEVYEESGLG